MNLTRKQVIIIFAVVLLILFFVLVIAGIIPGLKKNGTSGGWGGSATREELEFWGVSEAGNSGSIQALINEYLKIDKNVAVNYRQFEDADAYEKALLNALATGQAPDIFMFHSGWLAKHYDKVSPISETSFPLSQLQQFFPTVVEQDFSANNRVYALPLYVDTLALIYNKDTFDAKAVTSPPKKWSEFQILIPQLRELNVFNQIVKPAAGIGGSGKSILTASDIFNLLMMQFGNQTLTSQNRINLGSEALVAFNFYLQFANPSSAYYTWNDNLLNSVDSFSQGQTAIIFDYASRIPLIKEKNPYLSVGISQMPQLYDASQAQPVNHADYWGLSVSKQSKKISSAWKFALFATANPNASETFLQEAKKPPALRVLIEKYKNDPEFGVFARQALTARSWLQPDNSAVKQIFSNMIESVLSGRVSSENALRQAENEINDLIK